MHGTSNRVSSPSGRSKCIFAQGILYLGLITDAGKVMITLNLADSSRDGIYKSHMA